MWTIFCCSATANASCGSGGKPSSNFLAHLRLTVHERSSTVYPVSNGIPFLGFVTYPSHRLLKRRNGIAFARRFRQQLRQLAAGTLDYADVAAAVRGWLAHAAHGDTYGLRRALVSQHVIPRSASVEQSPIFARTYDLVKWLIPVTIKFPRHQRFVLATAMQQAALGLQERLIEAVRLLNSADTLRAADVELDKLRFYLRLSHDLGYISLGQQRHAGQMLAEIGRLLGSWQKRTVGG